MAELFKYVRHLLKYEAGVSEDFEYSDKEKQTLAPLFQGFRELRESDYECIPTRVSVQNTHKLIDYAIAKGVSNHKDDPGGLTVCGITEKTWTKACSDEYFKTFGYTKIEDMNSVQWLLIIRRYYWDVWQANDIVSQALAEQVVDFYFHSGTSATKIIQKLLHVVPDGIIGQKTIRALLYANPAVLCSRIKRARLVYLLELSGKGKNSAFIHGWLRRLVDW